ncbi:amidase signature enzyme, partial [Coniophora puteana RWD-64-598 SS2]
MHLECQSCYARTLNPYNTNLTPGGSSGGEAALVAMKGSPMGIGTKVAETEVDLSELLRPLRRPGSDAILPATGPICNSARDMRLLLSAVLSARPASIDPSFFPVNLVIPDLGQALGRRLKVGLMIHDGVVLPHPPMLRALEMARERLKASDTVDLVEYVPFEHAHGYTLAV